MVHSLTIWYGSYRMTHMIWAILKTAVDRLVPTGFKICHSLTAWWFTSCGLVHTVLYVRHGNPRTKIENFKKSRARNSENMKRRTVPGHSVSVRGLKENLRFCLGVPNWTFRTNYDRSVPLAVLGSLCRKCPTQNKHHFCYFRSPFIPEDGPFSVRALLIMTHPRLTWTIT